MPELSHLEVDKRLADLEQDLGPALRSAYRDVSMSSSFSSELRAHLESIAAPRLRGTSWQGLFRQRLWPALVVAFVGVIVVGIAVFSNQPQTVSAGVVDQLEDEAFSMAVSGGEGCLRPGAGMQQTGGMVLEFQNGPDETEPRGALTNTIGAPDGSSTELSERLAQVLGVSGDRVRQAMIATIRDDLPGTLPPDPMASIAQQLGVPSERVCAAFFPQPPSPAPVAITSIAGGGPRATQPRGDGPSIVVPDGPNAPNVINLSTATADQLRGPAERLGVTSERLATAVHAAVPATLPPPPPNPDEIIRKLSARLGLRRQSPRSLHPGRRQGSLLVLGVVARVRAVDWIGPYPAATMVQAEVFTNFAGRMRSRYESRSRPSS